MVAAFVGDARQIERVFFGGRIEAIAERCELVPGIYGQEDLDRLAEVEAIFSTWGMPALTSAQLEAMPSLKVVFYAAGTVAYFAEPFLARGIRISSAWRANAVPVAEFVVSQILLACKGYFHDIRGLKTKAPGVYGESVALLGAGAVGTAVIEMLRHHLLDVIVYDPFLSAARAVELGVRQVSLEEAFQQAFIVSNHLLDVPATTHLIRGEHLSAMRPGATFINTGRGGTVRHDEMTDVLTARTDLFALLDVTDPEPLPSSNPLRQLPNVLVSSHIAGSIGQEVGRMADLMIEELNRYLNGDSLLHEVA